MMTPIKATIAALAAVLSICGNSAAPAQTEAPKPAAPKPAAAAPKPAAPKPAANTAVQAAPAPGGRSVCVASAIGHRFEMQKIGMTIFGNALDGVAIDSWGIDDAAVRKVQQLLGNRFSVRRIAVPKASLAAFEAPPANAFLPGDQFGDFVKTIARSAGKCDFYITLTRTRTGMGHPSNQSFGGLGIFTTGALINERFYVFASFLIRLYDSNLTVIKTASPKPDWVPSIMYSPSTMHKKVDASWWPASGQAAAQSTQLKNTVRALVEEGLAKSLPELFQ